jgi:hypothetical protein
MADHRSPDALEPREPTVEDLRNLCRALNELGVRYVVIGGVAIRAANYNRRTMDIDLILDATPENEQKAFSVLSGFPDHAARELQPGELSKYQVIRIADEIIVDLMRSAGGILYEEAARNVVVREVDGVQIPFASPQLLCRMKAVTHPIQESRITFR